MSNAMSESYSDDECESCLYTADRVLQQSMKSCNSVTRSGLFQHNKLF